MVITNEDNNNNRDSLAILIINLDKKYVENVKLLSQDLKKEFKNLKIKKLKLTPANNLVLILEDRESASTVLHSQKLFKNNKKLEINSKNKETKKKDKFEKIIKGLSYKMAKENLS